MSDMAQILLGAFGGGLEGYVRGEGARRARKRDEDQEGERKRLYEARQRAFFGGVEGQGEERASRGADLATAIGANLGQADPALGMAASGGYRAATAAKDETFDPAQDYATRYEVGRERQQDEEARATRLQRTTERNQDRTREEEQRRALERYLGVEPGLYNTNSLQLMGRREDGGQVGRYDANRGVIVTPPSPMGVGQANPRVDPVAGLPARTATPRATRSTGGTHSTTPTRPVTPKHGDTDAYQAVENELQAAFKSDIDRIYEEWGGKYEARGEIARLSGSRDPGDRQRYTQFVNSVRGREAKLQADLAKARRTYRQPGQ